MRGSSLDGNPLSNDGLNDTNSAAMMKKQMLAKK